MCFGRQIRSGRKKTPVYTKQRKKVAEQPMHFSGRTVYGVAISDGNIVLRFSERLFCIRKQNFPKRMSNWV
jgi:hypothetical protein